LSGKFFAGLLMGIVLSIFVTAGAGYYFFVRLGRNIDLEPAPVAIVESQDKDKIATLLDRPDSAAGKPEFKVSLQVPGMLKSKIPANYNLLVRLNAPEHVVQTLPLSGKEVLEYRFSFPANLQPGEYRVAFFLCPAEMVVCDHQSAVLEARTFFSYGKESKALTDLGVVPFTRLHQNTANCFNSATLLSGKVEATDAFLTYSAGKKLALVLLSTQNSTSTSPEISSTDSGRGKKEIFFQPLPPLEQYISYAGPLEARKGGFAFKAPPQPNFLGPIMAFAVECVGDEEYKDCAKRAFPILGSSNSVPGRVHWLVGKNYLVPRCGMKDMHLLMHYFPKGELASSVPEHPEFIPGANY